MAIFVMPEYRMEINFGKYESLTEDELFELCVQNETVWIERDENKVLHFYPLKGTQTAAIIFNINGELGNWNKKTKLGIGFNESAAYFLPDSSLRSACSSWVSLDKWNSLDKKDKEKFAHITPDFIIELMSPSDNQKAAMEKMDMWRRNGVRLGWLIDPKKQETFIYRIDGTVTKIEGFHNILSGEDVLIGFELNLTILT